MNIRLFVIIVLAITGLFAAYMFGVKTSAPKPENIVPVAAESLPSGAVVLERVPKKSAKPKKPGTKVDREISVTVQPDAPASQPVTVDLQLVKEGDGRRVIASSPDGQIIAGMDVPIEQGLIPINRPWAAGLSCDPTNCKQTPGVWLERDLGRFRVGIEATRQSDGKMNSRAKVGWVF